MKEITDPELLEKLNKEEVTDPELLSQLEGEGWEPPTAEEEAVQQPPFYADPIEYAAMVGTGGISALRLGKPLAKEIFEWGTYGIPSLTKSLGKGTGKIVRGLGAKQLEKAIPVEKAAPIVYEGGFNWLPGAAKATSQEMQGIISLAQREKVSVLAPDITGDRTQALLFNAADKAIGGSGVTQRAAARVVKDMDEYGKRVLADLGGEYDPTVMGYVAREGMELKFRPIEKFGSDLYEIAAKEAAGVDTALTETTKAIKEIKKSKDWLYLPGQVKSVLTKVFNDISPPLTKGYEEIPAELMAKIEAQEIARAKIMDFTEVESIRRAISKLSFHKEISGDIGNRFAGKLLESIEKDMEVASKEAGTLAKEALDAARKFQRENIFGLFKGKTGQGKPSIGTRIQQIPNNDFLNIINKGNIEEVEGIKKVLPMETMQEVKRAWLTNIFSKHQRLLQLPEGKEYIVNAPAVAAEFNKFGDKYLKTLFSEKEFKMLDEFRRLASHIGYAEKIAGNPSGTAQTIYTIQLITGAGLAGYGTWKQDPVAAGTGIIFTFGGPYAIAKFMTSEAGFKYMTTGMKKSPAIREIVTKSIKSAAMIGTRANIDLNRQAKEEEP